MTEDFWGNIRKGLEEGLIAAADCAELLAQQGRARLDVAVAKQQIQRLFAEVGKVVHEKSRDTETVAISVEMRKTLERLSDLMEELREKEEIVNDLPREQANVSD
jgi:metal-dependent HD superfamily phosphatase/phosphodiesterase